MKPTNNFLALYWAFYKSTIAFNIGVSIAIAFISMIFFGGNFFVVFAGSFMSVGALVAFLYKEIFSPLEYYFYYNRGISKIKLIIFCLLFNILPATIILIIVNHVAPA